jgi:outer membrane protein
MNVSKLKIAHWVVTLACLLPISGQAQTATSDSLSLKSIISQVITNYPSIKKNEQELNTANANIGLAKSAHYPDINFNSSYSYIGPISSMTIPGFGSYELYPANNYSAAVNLSQTIYDFGKTTKNIAVETQNKELVKMSNEQLKQKLSSYILNVYYSIAFLQEAIRIKDEQLATLNEHLAFVQKKMATGSSTSYEILTTQVRISNIENQKTDLQTTLHVQICQLNTFLGQPGNASLKVKPELQPVQSLTTGESPLLDQAFNNREEMKMAQQKVHVAEMHVKTVHAQNNPVFNVNAAGGIKNGYRPDLNEGILNYSVGIGLKVPVFDATRTNYNLKKANAEIESNKQDMELTKRSIENEVFECEANVHSAQQKLAQACLQLKQANQAYTLAQISFKSGVITNLDLLDSSTSLSEAQLSVLKANIDYTLSFYKLKIATGEKIY